MSEEGQQPEQHKKYCFRNDQFEQIAATLIEDQELLDEFISWAVDRRPITDVDVNVLTPLLKDLLFAEVS